MLAVITCLVGIFAILAVGESLYRKKILRGEYLRKFIHISAGSFIAFWPWLIDWPVIQLLGLAMLAVIWLNHRLKKLHAGGGIKRKTYGFYLFAVAVVVLPFLTHNKLFFAIAMLNMALADGVAAIIGTAYGKGYGYKVFKQLKTIIGSMAFWFTSLCILDISLLFAHETFSFTDFAVLLLVLPPVLTAIENLGVMGFDNIAVPVAAVLALQIAAL